MLSGFIVLHRSSSDVGDEQEGARECFLPSSFFFFFPRFWRPVESEIPNTHTYSFFLHLFSLFLSRCSRFPRRHVTDTGRRRSRNRFSTRYFQKINGLTQREENIVRGKCGYLVIPRPVVVRLAISPSLLLSLSLCFHYD